MSHLEALSQWEQSVSRHLPHVSKPQAVVFALWSDALIVSQRCGTTRGALWVSELLGGSYDAWRQRLREWCYGAQEKDGQQRSEVVVVRCFAPVVRWIVTWWAPGEHRLALAMDASTLSERFTVLCISVVYRGCALAVAWCLVAAGEPGAWKPDGIALFDGLGGVIPPEWMVIVLADRRRYARWLSREIHSLHWHPYLRINKAGKARPKGSDTYQWLATFVAVHGYAWSGPVRCFTEASSRLDCTLVACWDGEYQDPWLIVTDLLPAQADVAWDAMGAWIECGFKDPKRGGWHWHDTKMQDPTRAQRHWVVMAVASWWVVSVGGERDDQHPASSCAALPPMHIAHQLDKGRKKMRKRSCFARGIMLITVALLQGQDLPMGRFVPFPWPTSPEVSHIQAGGLTEKEKAYP